MGNERGRETLAMREQQQRFMKRMDREHAALPPCMNHGFNKYYFQANLSPQGHSHD